MIHGSEASVFVNRSMCRLIPNRRDAGQTVWEDDNDMRQLNVPHWKNWLECIKSRQKPIADVEDGHRVATACHLANISLRVGRKLRWDTDKEEIAGDREASTYLVRPYRKPWDDVLRSLQS